MMNKLYNGFTEEKWERICTHPYYASIRDTIINKAEEYINTQPKYPSFSDLHLYETTGNRSKYESSYFALEHRVRTLFLAYMFTKDEEKYIPTLADTIWIICSLESWGLPAHAREHETLRARYTYLELGSCLLGYTLSETLAFVEDKLPELVVRKLKHEIRERVIEPYKNHGFGWMKATHNWSAVCIAGILGTYVYSATPEEVEAEIPYMRETAECYLSGFADEGCCREGYAYWLYGFTYFCIFADILKSYTNGKINYFDMPKVHAIAKFQENITMNDTQCVSFSDCGLNFNPPAHFSHFLKKVYPDVQIPSIPKPEFTDLMTYLLWIEPDFAVSKMSPQSIIYSEAQWFLCRREAYTLACKAGCNNEPHNHNDVGSFLVSKNGKITFCDPGGGEYTRQYFSNERYDVLEPSARSHSLPIINGRYQVVGKEISTIYVERENEYAFSMQNAYDVASMKSLKRHFVCENDRITLTDTYEFSERPESVVERFSTFTVPEFVPGAVTVGDSVLEYDAERFEVSLTSETCVRGNGNRYPLYLIDLKVKNPEEKMEFVFNIK